MTILDRAFPLEFKPDLIIEVTNVCDLSCAGCYAPNALVTPGSMPAAVRGGKFLDPKTARDSLEKLHLSNGKPRKP